MNPDLPSPEAANLSLIDTRLRTHQKPRFNPTKAVNRLVAGEPAKYVFGLMFGWPLKPLAEDSLRAERVSAPGGYDKALAATLLTAKSGDTALALDKSKVIRLNTERYTLDTPVAQILASEQAAVEDAANIAKFSIFRASPLDRRSLLYKTTDACRELLSCDYRAVASVINVKLSEMLKSSQKFVPQYLELLQKVYQADRGVDPSVRQHCELVDTSYSVLGRPASGDLTFLVAHNMLNMTKQLASSDNRRFIASHFQLKQRPDGRLYVALKPEFRSDLEKNYKFESVTDISYDGAQVNILTGCPANGSIVELSNGDSGEKYGLLEAIIRHLNRSIIAQAKK